MEKHKIGSALVVSDWWHLRRVRWSFETVFQGTGKKNKIYLCPAGSGRNRTLSASTSDKTDSGRNGKIAGLLA